MQTMNSITRGRLKGGIVAALLAIGTVGMASGSAEAVTLALTVPAHAGHAWQPGSATCFSTPSFSNAVQNVCNSGQSWLIPISNTPANNGSGRFVSFFAGVKTGGTGGIPHCRAIARAPNDANGFIGPDTNITSTNTPFSGGNVSALDSLHADCFFPTQPTNQLTHVRVEWFQSQFGG